MHYHLEIVMPPTNDIHAAVAQVLEPFNENGEGEDYDGKYSFWDWWVIGGRWSGAKLEATLDPTALDSFYKELVEREITVSSLVAGKREISPADQVPFVDELWWKYFPQLAGQPCLLFNHYRSSYKNDDINPADIATIATVPMQLNSERVIFAALNHSEEKLIATEMLATKMWNGVTHQDTTWDGRLDSAIRSYKEQLSRYSPEYASKRMIQDDWIVVTVEYHS